MKETDEIMRARADDDGEEENKHLRGEVRWSYRSEQVVVPFLVQVKPSSLPSAVGH